MHLYYQVYQNLSVPTSKRLYQHGLNLLRLPCWYVCWHRDYL